MKIGIVSPYFYPWYGGITEHVYHLYKELKERGHSVKIITPFDGSGICGVREDLIQLGKPFTLILNGSVVKIPLIPKRLETVDSILEREKFDLIHLHQPVLCILGRAFLKCVQLRKNAGRPRPNIVGTFHACGGGSERFLIKRFGFLFRHYQYNFDYRIAVSEASRDFILPVLPGIFNIIPNGVDVNRFANETQKISSFDDGKINILFVGRLEPRKGLARLIRSIPYINELTKKRFRLIVVGDGIMLDYYKKKVPRGFEEKIVFTGEVSFEDLPKYYKTAHIFCSPASYGESFGIVLIEAMAAGLPIVAGNNEGYRKVIKDGLNGILVRTEDPRDLAINLVKLIDNEKMRSGLAKGNYEESKKYSWSNVVNAVESVYIKAIGKEILKTPAYEK